MRSLDGIDLNNKSLDNAIAQSVASISWSNAQGKIGFDFSDNVLAWGTGSSTKNILDLKIHEFATPTADLAMGGYGITGLVWPDVDSDVATKEYVDYVAIMSRIWKGDLLHSVQLYSGGIKQASVFFLTNLPANDDTVVLFNDDIGGDTTETFLFKIVLTEPAENFEVLIGATDLDTMTNLVAVINDHSTLWSAYLCSTLDKINPDVVIIYRKLQTVTSYVDAIYGTITNDYGKIIDYADEIDYSKDISIILPSSFTVKNFGFGNKVADLKSNETHSTRADDMFHTWDSDGQTWVDVGAVTFTEADVRATVLTGLSLLDSTPITATDTVLEAQGKLQAQITNVGFKWSEITTDQNSTPYQMVAENGYIANNLTDPYYTRFLLPVAGTVGDVIRVTGKGAGGWSIEQNAGNQIHFGNISTFAGVPGYLQSGHFKDSIELVCVVGGASSEWNVVSSVGNIDIEVLL